MFTSPTGPHLEAGAGRELAELSPITDRDDVFDAVAALRGLFVVGVAALLAARHQLGEVEEIRQTAPAVGGPRAAQPGGGLGMPGAGDGDRMRAAEEPRAARPRRLHHRGRAEGRRRGRGQQLLPGARGWQFNRKLLA